MNAMELAAWTHAEFVKIHPFVDGNGRTSRMIMNYQLMAAGFLPVSIAKENRLPYFETLEAYAMGGDLKPFAEMIASLEELDALKCAITEEEIQAEMSEDLADTIKLNDFSEDTHRLTVKNCLTIRHWLEKHHLNAFSVDFMDVSPSIGLECMPFMEACKAMARGIGYAGEGDILIAVMTGALLQGFGSATFVEIFCPDWKNNTLFLSHMGEVNYALTEGQKTIKEMNFIYTDAQNPVVKYTCYKEGSATFLNVFRGPNGYKMLVAPVTMENRPVRISLLTVCAVGCALKCLLLISSKKSVQPV